MKLPVFWSIKYIRSPLQPISFLRDVLPVVPILSNTRIYCHGAKQLIFWACDHGYYSLLDRLSEAIGEAEAWL